MEGIKKVVILDSGENGSSSSPADGKPPNPLTTTPGFRRCFSGSGDVVDSSSIKKSFVRHPSLVSFSSIRANFLLFPNFECDLETRSYFYYLVTFEDLGV